MEVKQRLQSAEDDLAFLRGHDSVLALTNATKYVDGGGCRLDVDVDEFLETVDVRAFRPVS